MTYSNKQRIQLSFFDELFENQVNKVQSDTKISLAAKPKQDSVVVDQNLAVAQLIKPEQKRATGLDKQLPSAGAGTDELDMDYGSQIKAKELSFCYRVNPNHPIGRIISLAKAKFSEAQSKQLLLVSKDDSPITEWPESRMKSYDHAMIKESVWLEVIPAINKAKEDLFKITSDLDKQIESLPTSGSFDFMDPTSIKSVEDYKAYELNSIQRALEQACTEMLLEGQPPLFKEEFGLKDNFGSRLKIRA